MITNYRLSTIFVCRSALLSELRGGAPVIGRARYEAVFDQPQDHDFLPAWSVHDESFWRMWGGSSSLPDGFRAWTTLTPVRPRPVLRVRDTTRRVDVKVERFVFPHANAAIVTCISRRAHLNDTEVASEIQKLRNEAVFTTPVAGQAAGTGAPITLMALGRAILSTRPVSNPTPGQNRERPFTIIAPCTDDGRALAWTAQRKETLARGLLRLAQTIPDPAILDPGGGRDVAVFYASTAAALIGGAAMTRAGQTSRISLYHRNLTLGVMQTLTLLQLTQELNDIPEGTPPGRRSVFEVARNASVMLRRVQAGRGIYRSMLLHELVERRRKAVLEASRYVASPLRNETPLDPSTPA
jgi:hypothetical protein